MKKLLLVLTFLMLFGLSHADAALPPTRFHIAYNGSNVKDDVFYAAVLECYSSNVLPSMRNSTNIQHSGLLIEEYDSFRNCTWYPEVPGGEIDCSNSVCEFYPRTDILRLAVYIPSINRTFVGGAEQSGFGDLLFNISSSGEVKISKAPTPLPTPLIPPSGDMLTLIAYALVLTLAVELITSFIYLRLRKLNKGILWSVVLANIISVPLLWLLLWMVGSNEFLVCLLVLFGEFAVFVFEALVIFFINRKRMKIADAFAMSFINNLASFLVGFAVIIAVSLV